MTKPFCIIVDVDGTLADCTHRRHFVEKAPKDWGSFFDPANVLDDVPIPHTIDLVRAYDQANLINETPVHIIVVSGRPARLRMTTAQWLDVFEVPHDEIFTRADGDFRADDIVKEEILDNNILPFFTPLFALDDRTRVVQMWRRRGISCFQVAEGDF